MSGRGVLHYEFLEKIGAGGMGEVHKAHDRRLNRFVAIKVLAAGSAADPDRRRRFIQEAQAASGLSHPNIIIIHDIFHEGDIYYIVMEYVVGKTLLDVIPPGGMRAAQVLQYATQMADALSVAHAAGIVHRDFKPANVMITGSGLVKILDFGLAKLVDRPSWLEASTAATANSATIHFSEALTLTHMPLTTEGSILGTVNYMSPEQAEGKRVDARSDIFSFGAVLYEMVTGRRAFHGESDVATLSAVLRDDVRPISDLAPDVPHELDDLIRGCLRKDPNARWQSIREVEMGLTGLKRRSDAGVLHARPAGPASAISGSTPRPVAATTSPAGKKLPLGKALTLGAVAIALLFLAGTAWWWTSQHGVSRATGAGAVAPTAVPQQPLSPPTDAAPSPASPGATANDTKPPAISPAPRESASTTSANTPPKPAVAATPVTPTPPTAVETATVSIPDGKPLRIALAEDVPLNASEGQEISFRVLEDFKAVDQIIIPKGAAVTGTIVSEGAKKKFLGMGGKMTFKLSSADAVNGQKITVRATAGRRSDGPATRSLDTGKYAKAKDLAAARGTDYIAYVDGDQTLSLAK